jgi:hypothetical protein
MDMLVKVGNITRVFLTILNVENVDFDCTKEHNKCFFEKQKQKQKYFVFCYFLVDDSQSTTRWLLGLN